MTWDNRFCWKSFGLCVLSSLAQIITNLGIIVALKASKLSGLNIGIIEALWAISPFLVAFTEWIL